VDRQQRLRRPRAPFTVVERDETISDVAVRVYGTTDAADRLWRANRDLLSRRDSALTPGTFLRTPVLGDASAGAEARRID
jgi:hypothetical protein